MKEREREFRLGDLGRDGKCSLCGLRENTFGGKGSREEQIAHICQILVLAVIAPGFVQAPIPCIC